jgi:glycosyltransferase involved in cell wall biosynthesis
MPPKVSVCIATYQQRELLREAVESVLAQDYPCFEIVVGDDGSTDGTHEMLHEYEQRHPGLFKLALSPCNTGITENCNRVLALATGEYLAWLGGDDLWLPGKLRQQVEWMTQHPEAAICYTGTEIFESDTGRRVRLQHGRDNPFREGGVELLLDSVVAFCGSSVMGRRSALPEGGFDPRLNVVSDWMLWVQMARRGRVGYVEEILTRYRIHRGNVSRRADVLLREQMLAANLVEQEWPEYGPALARLRTELLWMHGLAAVKAGDLHRAEDLLRRSFAPGVRGARHFGLPVRLAVYVALRLRALRLLHLAIQLR